MSAFPSHERVRVVLRVDSIRLSMWGLYSRVTTNGGLYDTEIAMDVATHEIWPILWHGSCEYRELARAIVCH